MKFITHNKDSSTSIEGTSKQCTLETSYGMLVEYFGKPLVVRDGKVDVEWRVRFSDGSIAIIYNWKNGQTYKGPAGRPVENIEQWVIGGVDGKPVEHITELLSGNPPTAAETEENPVKLVKELLDVADVLSESLTLARKYADLEFYTDGYHLNDEWVNLCVWSTSADYTTAQIAEHHPEILERTDDAPVIELDGKAYKMKEGVLFSTTVYAHGGVDHDHWTEVQEIKEGTRQAVVMLLKEKAA